MGPKFGMIKDENEDPSSAKKEREREKRGKEATRTRAYYPQPTGREREGSIKCQKYKKQRRREEARGRIKSKEAAAIFLRFPVSFFSVFTLFLFIYLFMNEWMNGKCSPPRAPSHVIVYNIRQQILPSFPPVQSAGSGGYKHGRCFGAGLDTRSGREGKNRKRNEIIIIK